MSCSERIRSPACSASDLANNQPTLQDALLALVLGTEAIRPIAIARPIRDLVAAALCLDSPRTRPRNLTAQATSRVLLKSLHAFAPQPRTGTGMVIDAAPTYNDVI